METITISRQLGSLGDEVAQAVAQKLNFRVVSRELINQAAIRSGAPEMALAVIDDLGLLSIHPSVRARRAFLETIDKVVKEINEEGKVVIVGRAGQMILQSLPGVLHVKVIAPSIVRAERIAFQLGISLEAALAQITASDRSRRNYLKRYYRARWDNPELYDLIVSTARLKPEKAADIICQTFSQCIHPFVTEPLPELKATIE
jgi:cytidylate kinase